MLKGPAQLSRSPGWGVSRFSASELGLVGQLRGSMEGEVIPIRPGSKDLRDFARLPTALNHGYEPQTP